MPARLAGWLRRGASLVSAAMFAAVFVVFVLKVALRYGFDVNLAWADEICSVLFIWVIFWANALVVPDRAQIRFDLVLRMLSPRGRRLAAYARTLLVGGLFAAGLPAALGFILFLCRERTPVLMWRLDWVYACFGLFLVSVVLRAIRDLVRLLRGGAA